MNTIAFLPDEPENLMVIEARHFKLAHALCQPSPGEEQYGGRTMPARVDRRLPGRGDLYAVSRRPAMYRLTALLGGDRAGHHRAAAAMPRCQLMSPRHLVKRLA